MLFYLLDGIEHVGLAVVVAVRTHTQVHLLGVGVALERLGDAQDRVGRALSQKTERLKARNKKEKKKDKERKKEKE